MKSLQRLGQRRQAHPADADPLRHARARNVHARARVDLGLPIQRQVIVVLGHHHLRQQARRRDALVDHLRGHWRGLDRLAARAGVFAADVAQHEELGRHAVELLADLFADALEGLRRRRSGWSRSRGDDRCAAGSRAAPGAPPGASPAARRRLGLSCGGAVLQRGVGQDGVEQHRLGRSTPGSRWTSRSASASGARSRSSAPRSWSARTCSSACMRSTSSRSSCTESATSGVSCWTSDVRAGSIEHGPQYPSRARAREAGHSPIDKCRDIGGRIDGALQPSLRPP